MEQVDHIPRPAVIADIRPETPTEKTFTLRFTDGEPFNFQPGQFCMLSVLGKGRRYPQGDVTSALHELTEGDYVGIRGPRGNGFPLQDFVGRDILVVAGGIGLPAVKASLLYLLDHRSDYRNVTLLYGARTPRDRVYKDELAEWEQSPDIVCQQTVDMKGEDDSWEGHVGLITTLFGPLEIDGPQTTAIIVGPAVMYPFVVAECRQKGIADENMYFSLERHMKCGVGKCGHCTIGDKYVCIDGPVFTYAEMQEMKGE